MKCLVTGAAGFIGSHLCERLLKEGHEVLAVDSLEVGRFSNIEHLEHTYFDAFTFWHCNVNALTAPMLLMAEIDVVFHLAARADIVPSIQEPGEYHFANVSGTISILEASRQAQVKRFVYAASSSCYGLPDSFPTPETAPIRCEYPYALTKNLGEQYVMHWSKVYGLPAVSLRLFNVYGPRARTSGTYGAVFGVFLSQLHHGKPLTVVGDGTQTRDFTFVTDVVDAFIKAAQSDKVGEIYNVGSGGTYSVNRLVELLGAKSVDYLPKRPAEPDQTFADISKIKRDLGWSPQVSFEEGVARMKALVDAYSDAPLWDKASIQTATEDWFKYLK